MTPTTLARKILKVFFSILHCILFTPCIRQNLSNVFYLSFTEDLGLPQNFCLLRAGGGDVGGWFSGTAPTFNFINMLLVHSFSH
jgi:hypothetical protein